MYLLWKPIYFDANATTLVKYTDRGIYRNPSAFYADTEKQLIAKLRDVLREKLGMPNHRVIFTSGASEANTLFCKSVRTYCTEFEHKNMLLSAHQSTWAKIREGVDGAVSVMAINNETGNVFPLADLRKKYSLIHTDGAQYFGKMVEPPPVDAITISFHKMHGPYGLGALVVPDGLIQTQIPGAQNDGLRGGTENISAIADALVAIEINFKNRAKKNKHLRNLVAHFRSELLKRYAEVPQDAFRDCRSELECLERTRKINGVMFINIPFTGESINTCYFSIINQFDGENRFCNVEFRRLASKRGCQFSIGSACNVGNKEASHVLHHLKLPFIVRCGVLRISFEDHNTHAEIREFFRRCEDLFG